MSDLPTVPVARAKAPTRRRRRRVQASGTDRIFLALMVLIPTALVVGLVWLPAVATVVLSFASWTGVGSLDTIKWIGTDNYVNVFTIYPSLTGSIAEAVAQWMHRRVRRELGIEDERGKRYSWGYGACPDLEDNEKVLHLLGGERIGLTCDEETGFQYQPEQTTSALISSHPRAKYFVAR